MYRKVVREGGRERERERERERMRMKRKSTLSLCFINGYNHSLHLPCEIATCAYNYLYLTKLCCNYYWNKYGNSNINLLKELQLARYQINFIPYPYTHTILYMMQYTYT